MADGSSGQGLGTRDARIRRSTERARVLCRHWKPRGGGHGDANGGNSLHTPRRAGLHAARAISGNLHDGLWAGRFGPSLQTRSCDAWSGTVQVRTGTNGELRGRTGGSLRGPLGVTPLNSRLEADSFGEDTMCLAGPSPLPVDTPSQCRQETGSTLSVRTLTYRSVLDSAAAWRLGGGLGTAALGRTRIGGSWVTFVLLVVLVSDLPPNSDPPIKTRCPVGLACGPQGSADRPQSARGSGAHLHARARCTPVSVSSPSSCSFFPSLAIRSVPDPSPVRTYK